MNDSSIRGPRENGVHKDNLPPSDNPKHVTREVEKRLTKLGIDALLDSQSREDSMDLLDRRFAVKAVEVGKMKLSKETELEDAQQGLDLLSLFCFYEAQREADGALFMEEGNVEAPIREALDLIEKIRTNVRNGMYNSAKDVKKLDKLVDNIFKESSLDIHYRSLVEKPMKIARRMIRKTIKKVIKD